VWWGVDRQALMMEGKGSRSWELLTGSKSWRWMYNWLQWPTCYIREGRTIHCVSGFSQSILASCANFHSNSPDTDSTIKQQCNKKKKKIGHNITWLDYTPSITVSVSHHACLEVSYWMSVTSSRKMLGQYLKLGNHHFLPYLFPFIIHKPFSHIIWDAESTTK
jgi:hypothetical protein